MTDAPRKVTLHYRWQSVHPQCTTFQVSQKQFLVQTDQVNPWLNENFYGIQIFLRAAANGVEEIDDPILCIYTTHQCTTQLHDVRPQIDW